MKSQKHPFCFANFVLKDSFNMSTFFKTFIQQTKYDGKSYTKGSVVDILDTYNIGCVDFPFDMAPKTRKPPEREWYGEDGKDIFVRNDGLPLEDYDIDVEFCYKGTVDEIGSDMSSFLDYIRGRNTDAVGGRLVLYDEHVGFGRKDVIVDEVDPQMYSADASDPDALFDFKVKFHVYDPATVIVPTRNSSGKVVDFVFK